MFRIGEIRNPIHALLRFEPFCGNTGHQFGMPHRIYGGIKDVAEAEILITMESPGIAFFLEEDGWNQMVGVKVSSIVVGRKPARAYSS